MIHEKKGTFNIFNYYYYKKKCQFLELLILKSGTSLEKDLIKWEKENPEPEGSK